MKIVLEFLYTGTIEASFNEDNLVEANLAADFFQLSELQRLIVKNLKDAFDENVSDVNRSPELLSVMISKMPFHQKSSAGGEEIVNDQLLDFLAESVAKIHFDNIPLSTFSIDALAYVLSYTFNSNKTFSTPEYMVFRYSVLLAAQHIDLDTYNMLEARLPDLDFVEIFLEDEQEFNHKKFNKVRQKIYRLIHPLIKFIDFRRIDGRILSRIIEPLGIIPSSIIIEAYRNYSTNKRNLPSTRGITKIYWDEGGSGGHIYVMGEGSIATTNHQCYENIRTNFVISNNGTYEWDIRIEEIGRLELCVGVHANSKFNYDLFGACQKNTWLLSSAGVLYSHTGSTFINYKFSKGDQITLRLNMNERTLVFSFNGKMLLITELKRKRKYYPIVSLNHPAKVRLSPNLRQA
ncbi:1082_t:CDS:1 [Funneliformis geosporum]|uniref:1082_t:CDS:1 n=1 Tax=Funneliformis geosporum TaxID=1117311 RepID=A0A9W4X107_9GLOM|nr:1082_t:CDS:1 [Funneliformis geosporum]